MEELSYAEVSDDIMKGMRPPRALYIAVVGLLATTVLYALCIWIYQAKTGMGVTGLSIPVGWATYIGNFVFWIGIAHSGTLISAILLLVRAKWRTAVSRSSEAMTIFAVMTAGLFPLIHLGRVWVFFFVLPYPSMRHLWPNFISPLVWDVCAVSTYFTVSLIFWYVGLIPDLASARDRMEAQYGRESLRAKVYRRLALGWSHAGSQWRHYGRGYLYFAALATPLVVSVHSVVSWDFAMSNLPGWHTTIFAPYFVAGAIHSGLAMVLLLVMPMRRLLGLQRIINVNHYEAVALTMIVTTCVVAYAYIMEPWIAWYSGDVFEGQFSRWRPTGFEWWEYWILIPLNVLSPLLFVFRRVRRSKVGLYLIALAVVAGMWFERYMIVSSSLAHDFMPHNWHYYAPSWVELSITAGSFAFFLMWFFLFAKLFPTVPTNDVKELLLERRAIDTEPCRKRARLEPIGDKEPSVVAVYPDAQTMLQGLKRICDAGFDRVETFSPLRVEQAEKLLKQPTSPVRFWAFAGAVTGVMAGFGLAIGAALVNALVVGGKTAVSITPYCIVGFEATVLIGSLVNLGGLVWYMRLYRIREYHGYDPRFGRDKFGVMVACARAEMEKVKGIFFGAGAEEVKTFM